MTRNIASLFVLLLLGAAVMASSEPEPQAVAPSPPPFQRVDLHYFHPTIRCVSCLKFETLAAEVAQDTFPDAIAERRLSWQAHDFELPENAALVDSFAIEGSTLMIAESLGGAPGRWGAVDHAWHLLDSPDSLRAHVAAVIHNYLGSTP